ncbi:LIC_10190 family membrane protein [Flavobacterium sp.]|uniref:LIC_10190 family membrane protein n=1 Tax=Flavobacterium sp. TaxID=239 RepID=UPI00286CF2E3|nr:hypothetical protein [Flavobacterium sp.]
MILIALSWLVLLLFFIPTGIALKSLLNLKSTGNYIPIFLGIFIQCLGLSICAFFFKIGLELFIANFILSIGLSIWKSKEIKENLKGIKSDLKNLSTISKLSVVSIFIFSLYKCAQFPFIIDNESYYIQTIKWLNEYGYVKGLGNLHIYFGQNSSFHVLQAGFNFNFLTDRSNDLNGFLLNLSSLYFITEFEKRNKINSEIHWIGLVLGFNILFFQFINAPSPDLSIVLISQILFYYFLDKEDSLDNFKIITLLFLFLILVKITIAPFVLIIIYLAYNNKKRILFLLISGAVVAAVLIIKNTIITGYPLYPLNVFPINTDWKIPQELLEFISYITQKAGYFKNSALHNPTLLQKLDSWLHLGGINRIFNVGMLFLFGIGIFTKKIQTQIRYKILYIIFLIHFIILLLTSPQFRFFLPEFVFFSVLILNSIFTHFKTSIKFIQYAVLISIVLPMILIEFIDYKNFTENKLHQQTEKNSWNQILTPNKNSKYAEIKFEKIKEGNLNYYSPTENFFFYGTANGELPCVNKVQIDYLKKKYHFKPQLRTSNLGDGFYSKSTIKDE